MKIKVNTIGFAVSTLVVFLSLFLVEVLILSGMEHTLPNTLSSPLYEFKNMAMITWPQNPWETTKEWVTLPALIIGFSNESSGSYAWALYYHLPALFTHLLASLMVTFYLFRCRTNVYTTNDMLLLSLASVLILIPTFYLSIAAHCAGANWLINVIILAMQSSSVSTSFMLQRLAIDLPLAYLALQWVIFAAGIFTYFMLYRKTAQP